MPVALFFLLIGAVVLVGYKLNERRHGEILRALALKDRDSPVSGSEPIPEIVA